MGNKSETKKYIVILVVVAMLLGTALVAHYSFVKLLSNFR